MFFLPYANSYYKGKLQKRNNYILKNHLSKCFENITTLPCCHFIPCAYHCVTLFQLSNCVHGCCSKWYPAVRLWSLSLRGNYSSRQDRVVRPSCQNDYFSASSLVRVEEYVKSESSRGRLIMDKPCISLQNDTRIKLHLIKF